MTPQLNITKVKICPFTFIVGFGKLGLLIIIPSVLQHRRLGPSVLSLSCLLLLSQLISSALMAINSFYILVTPKFGSMAWTTPLTSPLGYQVDVTK